MTTRFSNHSLDLYFSKSLGPLNFCVVLNRLTKITNIKHSGVA